MIFTLSSCLLSKNLVPSVNDIVVLDNLFIKSDSTKMEFFTEFYEQESDLFRKKENFGEICRVLENKIQLSEKTKAMIENDGGIKTVMKNLLSKNNFENLSHKFSITIGVNLKLKDLAVSSYSISIRSENINKCHFTSDEIRKMNDYFQKISFDYSGDVFRDETVLYYYSLSYSCTTSKSINTDQNPDVERVVYTKNNGTIIVQQDSLHIQFYTPNYTREYENFHKKENRGEILMAIENNIRLSPETSKMIEEDGPTIMKSILSKDNFDKFTRRIPIRVYVILSLEDLTISEYRISMLSKNANDLHLTNNEIEKLFDFCKNMRFIYTGNDKFKNEKVPAGWMFTVKK